jgi:DNA-directed RNA polymerase subunit RPC12/RpoP
MTTLLDERETLVVRCDECRRLWPVTRERLEAVWESDEETDRHRCPVCAHPYPWREG